MKNATIEYAIDDKTGGISFLVTIDGDTKHYLTHTISYGFYRLYNDIVPQLEEDGYDIEYNFDGFADLGLDPETPVEKVEGNVVYVNFG